MHFGVFQDQPIRSENLPVRSPIWDWNLITKIVSRFIDGKIFILRYRLELWGQISNTYKFKGRKYEHKLVVKKKGTKSHFIVKFMTQNENNFEKDERNKNYVGLMFAANNYQLPAYVSSVT